jgi:PAS domain S-box-containing protein
MAWRNEVVQSGLRKIKRARTSLLLALLAFAMTMLIYSAVEFRAQVDKSQATKSDNRVWTISQIEVDHRNLLWALARLRIQQYALRDSGSQTADAARIVTELAVAFDILYSRIEIVEAALVTADLPEPTRTDLAILIRARDRLADMLDTMNPYDPAQLQAFEDTITGLGEPARGVVLGALGYFVAEAETSRKDEVMIWTRFLMATILLLVIMALAICISALLHRQLIRQFDLIKAQTNNVRLVYEASMLAVIVTNRAGEIQLFNSAAERTFGCSEIEAKGRNIADMMIPQHFLDKHQRGMKRYRETGRGAFIDQGTKRTTSLRHDGTEFPIELSIVSETDAQGDEILIAFIRDISEQLAYEKNLCEARDEARRHANVKTMFLATMSHEMRTPLHGLLASLDLIEDHDIGHPTRDLIKIARNCGLRTLHQINDVLELTQIGEVKEPLSSFAPVQAISGIMNELRALARDRGNQLSLNVVGLSSDAMWLGRPQIFVRVMYNLIGNALKFTKDGTVTISLTLVSSPASSPTLSVSVRDDGIGISPEDQVHLFDLFFTSNAGDPVLQRSSTGLGLPIAQAGISKMGGALVIDSQLGVGSTFSFDIPLEALQVSQTLHLNSVDIVHLPASLGLRCLVVDDNHVNLDLTAQMLRRLGCDVVTCDRGENAVVEAFEHRFDVVLMDLNMPGGISGTEATRQIRAQETTLALPVPTVVLALTADTTFDPSALLSQSRIDGVLHKPVRMHDLQKALGPLALRDNIGTDQIDAAVIESAYPQHDDFKELYDLIGQAHGKRLLNGVLYDIDAALNAIRCRDADAADHLHRAIGSTATVGLLEFSQHLRHAEDLGRAGADTALYALLTRLEVDAKQACKLIRQELLQGSLAD